MNKNVLKTKRNEGSVSAFINAIDNPTRKRDAKTVLALMKDITKKKPVMWGDSIVGFDTYHYVYVSGRERDWPMIGFSPRKNALTIYIMPGYHNFFGLLKELGPHTTGKSCLYIKDLDSIDMKVLTRIIKKGYAEMKKLYLSKTK